MTGTWYSTKRVTRQIVYPYSHYPKHFRPKAKYVILNIYTTFAFFFFFFPSALNLFRQDPHRGMLEWQVPRRLLSSLCPTAMTSSGTLAECFHSAKSPWGGKARPSINPASRDPISPICSAVRRRNANQKESLWRRLMYYIGICKVKCLNGSEAIDRRAHANHRRNYIEQKCGAWAQIMPQQEKLSVNPIHRLWF